MIKISNATEDIESNIQNIEAFRAYDLIILYRLKSIHIWFIKGVFEAIQVSSI